MFDKFFGLKGILLPALLFSAPACADNGKNYPCSQSKGETAYCQADIFVCNNGSVSASAKDCRQTDSFTRHSRTTHDRAAAFKQAEHNMACLCRQGLYCLSKKGKALCLADSGRKSPLPKRYNLF